MTVPVPWETADPDPDRERIPRSPTRDTRSANSSKRQIWYGLGTLSRAEKSGFGRLLNDVVHTYADVSTFSIPVLLYVYTFDYTMEASMATPLFATWMAMVGVATLIKGGWIAPLGSETLGWVSARYALWPLRFVYYNLVLAAGVYGGLVLGSASGGATTAFLFGGSLGAVAALVFPTLTDVLYEWATR